VIIELGPVLSGLVLAGRVGSSLAAQLATMQVTEQVDALEVLAVDPIRYLVAPRMISAVVMVPVLVTLAVFTAMWGGFMVAYLFLDIGPQLYFGEIPVFFKMKDVTTMLLKSASFGALIALIGTYVGMNARGGAAGVGQATIRSFVLSALSILVTDYTLGMILF
jgi:phospholipid/cholesterol/gamma-HCH transport system permease protein